MASSKTRKRITSNLDVYIQGKYSLNVKGKERYFWTNKKKEKEKMHSQDTHFKENIKDCPQGTKKIKRDRRLEIQKEVKNNMKGEYVGKSKCILAV